MRCPEPRETSTRRMSRRIDTPLAGHEGPSVKLGSLVRRLCIGAVFVSGTACDLKLDAAREIPGPLAERIAQKRAEVMAKPADANLNVELGTLYIAAEHYFEAADVLQSAKTQGADTSILHAGLAETYLELGYFRPCADELRACFQKNRDEPGCLYVFGMLMEGIQDRKALEEAQRAYRRLLQVAPDFRKAKLASSSLDQVEAKLAALPKPASQPASEPAAPAPATPTAPAAEVVPTPGHTSQIDPATGEDVGELNPYGQAIMKAMAAVRKNDGATAEAAFGEALKIRPDDASTRAGLAEAQFSQGKKAAAIENIEKAFAAEPTDPQVRWAFGRIMIEERRRVGEAVAAWRALVKDEPEYANQLGVPQRLEALSKFGK